jgi:hypothetical protein
MLWTGGRGGSQRLIARGLTDLSKRQRERLALKRRWIFLLGLAAGAISGAANGQVLASPLKRAPRETGPVPTLPVKAVPVAARPAPDLANPLDPLAPTTIQANPMQNAVFARTAVDHRFAGRSDVTGSLGFLCGLQPGHGETGGDAAYGVDPHGRFVGAKLSFAFR